MTSVENKDIEPLAISNDWLLENFIEASNKSEEGTMSVFLCVKGVIVTGYIIGGKRYFKELGETFEKSFKEKGNEGKIDLIAHYKKMGEEIYGINDEDDEKLKNPPTYFHLNKALILNGIQRINVGLWRGKINEVDGFSFGTFTDEPVENS